MALGIEGATGAQGQTPVPLSMTTSGTNRLIVVCIACETPTTLQTVASVTASGLVFAKRKQLTWTDASHNILSSAEIWWAWASAQLTALSITCTLTGTPDDSAATAFAISGIPSANSANPWDSNVALPATLTNLTTTAAGTSTTFSTTSNDTLVFCLRALCSANGVGNATQAMPGHTFIHDEWNTGHTNYCGVECEYAIFSSPQSGTAFGAGNNGAGGLQLADEWGFIVDAVSGDAPSVPVPVTYMHRTQQRAA